MTRAEVVTSDGEIAYVPLKFTKDMTDDIWVRTESGQIKKAVATIDLYLPSNDVTLEQKKSWKEESPYDRLSDSISPQSKSL